MPLVFRYMQHNLVSIVIDISEKSQRKYCIQVNDALEPGTTTPLFTARGSGHMESKQAQRSSSSFGSVGEVGNSVAKNIVVKHWAREYPSQRRALPKICWKQWYANSWLQLARNHRAINHSQIPRTPYEYRLTVAIPAKSQKHFKMNRISDYHQPCFSENSNPWL